MVSCISYSLIRGERVRSPIHPVSVFGPCDSQRVDGNTDGKALVKLVAPTELMRTREEKRVQAEAKAEAKAANKAAERAKRAARLEKGRVAPKDLFKPPNVSGGTYSSWDEDGIPLTDGEGKELSKSARKKAQKEAVTQKKLHEEWLEWQKEAETQQ